MSENLGASQPIFVEIPEGELPSGLHCDPNDPYCITCSDAAQMATVVRFDDATGLAVVAIGAALLEVDTSLVDDVRPGMALLIHGGVAIGPAEEATRG